jgi:hypothetical protein
MQRSSGRLTYLKPIYNESSSPFDLPSLFGAIQLVVQSSPVGYNLDDIGNTVHYHLQPFLEETTLFKPEPRAVAFFPYKYGVGSYKHKQNIWEIQHKEVGII